MNNPQPITVPDGKPVSELLTIARDRISDPHNYLNDAGDYAQNAAQESVEPTDAAAVKWCITGTIIALNLIQYFEARVISAMKDAMGDSRNLCLFAQNSSHFEVIQLYNKAIRMQEEKEDGDNVQN